MISVQSLRLRSNGNKYVLFAVVALFLQSCFLFKEKPTRPVVVNPDTNDSVTTNIDSTEFPTDTIGKPGRIILKDRYQIAILLPFSVDSYLISNFDYEDRTTQYKSLRATELYEGIRLALKELERTGMKMDVHVYDTHNQESEVRRIMALNEVRKSDLIIGPLFPKNVEIAAAIARKERIFLVSPLYPLINQNNDYVIAASPPFDIQVRQIAKYVVENYPASTVQIPAIEEESYKHYCQIFREAYAAAGGDSARITEGKLSAERMNHRDTNIVFMPSRSEAHVIGQLRVLNMLASSRPVILFGMPNWLEDFQNLEYAHLYAANYHYTTTLYMDNEDAAHEWLRKAYAEQYDMQPSKYTYRGYDLMKYFGILMKQYGVTFNYYFNAPNTGHFSHPFYIASTDGESDLRMGLSKSFVNQYVYIVRFKENKVRSTE